MLSRLSELLVLCGYTTNNKQGRMANGIRFGPRNPGWNCLDQVLDDSRKAGKCNPKIPRTELALGK